MSAPPEPHSDADPTTGLPDRATPTASVPARRRPPVPVRAAATILFLLAAMAVVVGASGLVGADRRDPQTAADPGADTEFLTTQAIVMAVLAVLYLVLGLQLWRGRRWAQVTTVAVLAVTGLLALGNATAEPSSLFGAVVALLVVLLLVAPPSARAYYRRRDHRGRSLPPPPRWQR